jgi:hypothetical protein
MFKLFIMMVHLNPIYNWSQKLHKYHQHPLIPILKLSKFINDKFKIF